MKTAQLATPGTVTGCVETKHGWFLTLDTTQTAVCSIRPSPENDGLYRPPNHDDPEFQALVASIRELGIQEPLVVTVDGWIVSGHRRHAAARIIGLRTVPVRVESFRRLDDPDRFLRLLREYNRQREKTLDEKLREELVGTSPEDAYQALIAHRQQRAGVRVDAIAIMGTKRRAGFSAGKRPFVDAIVRIVNDRRPFWPLSDRQVHYALMNAPPLRHAAKPGSRYRNDRQSWHDSCDVLTRARLAGIIPFDAIADITRPVTVWDVHQTPRPFVRQQLDEFMRNYSRDLLQSQPNHIEILGEKNTLDGIIRPVAMEFTIPYTLGRGYSSIGPRHDMAQRYRRSGKTKLVLLVLSDFDPEGEDICHSFARSLRDDFGIGDVHAIKVALKADQIREHRLVPMMQASAKRSSRKKRFIENHGDDVFELEALPPEVLQNVLRQAIDSVIDVDAFNHELDQEKRDAAYLDGVRQRALLALRDELR